MTDGSGSPDPPPRPEPWSAPDPSTGQPGQQPYYPPGSSAPGPYPPGTYGYQPAPPKPGIVALRPLGIGDILDGAVKLIRSNPKATLGLSAIVGFVASLPLAIGQVLLFREGGGLITGPLTPPAEPPPVAAMAAQSTGLVVSVLLTFVATTILTGLLTRVLGRAVFGGRITVGEAWRMTRSRVWALLGLALLVMLVITVPGLLVIGSLIGVGIALDLTALVVVGALATLAWFAYAVFMGTRLALASPALVLERLGIGDAMRRSWALVKGDTWRVFGIILLMQILIGLVSSVVTVPFTMGGAALNFLDAGSTAPALGAAVLVALGETLSAMLTYPFLAGVYGLLYADRRMRSEAFDLELQTAAAQPGDISVDDLWQPAHSEPRQP